QARARDEIIDRLDEMVIASAFLGELPGHGERREVLGAMLEPQERTRILEQIAHRGVDFVAKEAVTLSTTPVWRHGRLEPRASRRPVVRAWTGAGRAVLPGGSERFAVDAGAWAERLKGGGDAGGGWVPSEKPLAEPTFLPGPDPTTIPRGPGPLPSRAAA